jgi:hypothetical protein
MTIFYFDIQLNNESRSVDEEGDSLPDLEAARLLGTNMVVDLAREMVERKVIAEVSVLVRDEIGEVMDVRLSTIIKRVN